MMFTALLTNLLYLLALCCGMVTAACPAKPRPCHVSVEYEIIQV